MPVTLILFFASLLGIIAMIWKKLVLLKKQPVIVIEEEFLINIPDLQEVRHVTIKNTKRITYIVLVKFFRFTIRSSKYLKRKYRKARLITKYLIREYITKQKETQKKEVSGFLKMVSEYKHKVKEIKEKVKEEEKERKSL